MVVDGNVHAGMRAGVPVPVAERRGEQRRAAGQRQSSASAQIVRAQFQA
jgi:hypothetical protein